MKCHITKKPTKNQQPDKTPEDSTEPKINVKSKLNYNFSKFMNGKRDFNVVILTFELILIHIPPDKNFS